MPSRRIADTVVGYARSRIGCPYRWGGAGPEAFDCSGLVMWSYAQAGIMIPRTSQQQATHGSPVGRDALAPADVIIYYPDASHSALYTGNGRVVEASTYGRPVAEAPLDQAGPYHCARRYLPHAPQDIPVTLFGIDTSNNNWASVAECVDTITQAKAEGFSWVEAKVTQGSDFTDPYWRATLATATRIGLPIIGYHYVDTSSATGQVQNFTGAGGGPAVMLDFEDGAGDITNFWAVLEAFNSAGVTVALSYLPQWYWEQIGAPDISTIPGLVSSGYPISGENYAITLYEQAGGDTGEGWAPYGGATPVIWQFTDSANVNGLPLDANAFRGTPAELSALLTGTTPATTTTTQGGFLMALTEAQQQDIYNWCMWTFQQVAGVLTNNPGGVTALPGSPTPTGSGWPQSGENSAGQNLTIIDALSVTENTRDSIGAYVAQIKDAVAGQ